MQLPLSASPSAPGSDDCAACHATQSHVTCACRLLLSPPADLSTAHCVLQEAQAEATRCCQAQAALSATQAQAAQAAQAGEMQLGSWKQMQPGAAAAETTGLPPLVQRSCTPRCQACCRTLACWVIAAVSCCKRLPGDLAAWHAAGTSHQASHQASKLGRAAGTFSCAVHDAGLTSNAGVHIILHCLGNQPHAEHTCCLPGAGLHQPWSAADSVPGLSNDAGCVHCRPCRQPSASHRRHPRCGSPPSSARRMLSSCACGQSRRSP